MKIFLLFLLSIILNGLAGNTYLPTHLHKKAQGVLKDIWKSGDIHENPFEVKSFPFAGVIQGQVYEVFVNNEKKALSFYNSAKGRYDKFYFVVVYNLDLSIIRLRVLEYNEMYGGEITRPKWLKKFEGYHASKNLQYGKDIDAITGATLSAIALIEVVNRCSEFLMVMKNKAVF